MTTKKNLVKQVLMSILTAGVFSFSFGFASCSDEDMLTNEGMNPEMEQAYDSPALETYGLSYMDFITENDIQILDGSPKRLPLVAL